jgi:hypothetical protein
MRDAGVPAVTGSGSNGIVWVVDTAAGTLYALDAHTGAALLGAANAEPIGETHRFVSPAVVDGRVYVGTARGSSPTGSDKTARTRPRRLAEEIFCETNPSLVGKPRTSPSSA